MTTPHATRAKTFLALLAILAIGLTACSGGKPAATAAVTVPQAPDGAPLGTPVVAIPPTTAYIVPTDSTTTAAPVTTTTSAPADQRFLAEVDRQNLRTGPSLLDSSKVTTSTDGDLLDVAHSICDDMSKGGIPADPATGYRGKTPAEDLIQNEANQPTTTGKLTVLAVQVICPQYTLYLQQALSGHPPTEPAMTTFSDGTYRVGAEIVPGTYQTTLANGQSYVANCYWDRTDSNGNTIANNFITGAPQVRVTIRASDTGFHSDGCGTWQKVG